MRFSTAVLLGSVAARACGALALPDVAAQPDGSPSDPILKPETKVLADEHVEEHADLLAFGDDIPDIEGQEGGLEKRTFWFKKSCKFVPGDKLWPNKFAWNVLKMFVGGRLVNPDPIGSVCYAGDDYDAAKCAEIAERWNDATLHINHPTSIMSPLYTGAVCLPIEDPKAGVCKVGGYPLYVVNAQNVWDIQTAVNFARNTNIRLVVKNTGHDFAGKSSGSHSLSIRTAAMKDIKYIPKMRRFGWNGPAFKVAAGVQGSELYAAASKHSLVVVGGEGLTVGFAGGYIQGGGHSPLSSIMGMAADHVLSYDVVLANGRFVTANSEQNQDLFWALRGGGGSSFGVLVAVTVKAYPEFPASVSTFSLLPSAADRAKYASGDTSNPDFWSVVKTYLSSFHETADKGVYSYWNIFPTGDGGHVFNMAPLFGPKLTSEELDTLLKPTVDQAKKVGVTLEPVTKSFPTYYEAWKYGFPPERVGGYDGQFASRLWPRKNFEDKALFNETWEAIRERAADGYMIGFNIQPKLWAAGVKDSDVAFTPAWRKTVMHVITGITWDATIRDSNPELVRQMQKEFTEVKMKRWRELSPGAGSYLGEADINEPNRQESFWGKANYERLYRVKQMVDPTGVLFAESAVGSEDWTTGEDRLGRLCPVEA